MIQAQLSSGNHTVLTARSTNKALQNIHLASAIKCLEQLKEYHYYWCALATSTGVQIPQPRHCTAFASSNLDTVLGAHACCKSEHSVPKPMTHKVVKPDGNSITL